MKHLFVGDAPREAAGIATAGVAITFSMKRAGYRGMGVIQSPSLSSVASSVEADCVLMFSGGRDSTIAATRLVAQQKKLVLVTVTSGHLVGIARVEQRVRELKRLIPSTATWICVRQPEELKTDTSFYERTCLPCQHAYVVAAAAIARALDASALAFGYAGYQSDWPEQTPLATRRLSAVLARHGIELLLPAYDLASKEDAISQLSEMSLATESLEQKCSRQVTNVALEEARLIQQIALWEAAIEESLSASPPVPIGISKLVQIGDL